MPTPLSILDLAVVDRGRTVGEALADTVALARAAEASGYRRVWYAEHHNFGSIASAATSVVIAHVAAHTSTIRLGAGGVMLPNHAPLVIAEQYGTLAELHPGRIELGLGRAPGTDQVTVQALRRDPRASDRFPQDVVELQGWLGDEPPIAGVRATPGAGTHVPLYVLGSSLFGAQLAAQLGLPYAFASHFAPDALTQAVAVYRERFQPSDQLDAPHVLAAVNVLAAPSDDDAQRQLQATQRQRAKLLLGRGRTFTDDELDLVLDSPAGAQVRGMLRYTAVGTPDAAAAQVASFAEHADADEVIVAPAATDAAERLAAVELLAEAWLRADAA